MSLLTNAYLRVLYSDAQSSTYEHHSISFWGYLLSKVYFAEQFFYVDPQKPASPDDPLRRVDEQVKYFENGTLKTRILCFHEGKKTEASANAVQSVEGQAFEACATYCQSNNNITHVYALTTIGTFARTWKYSHATKKLEPLFGSAGLLNLAAYVDADSSQATQLDKSFKHMKQFPPSAVDGMQSHAYATGSGNPTPTVPSTAISSNSKDEFTAAQQDGEWHWSTKRQKYYRFDKANNKWIVEA